MKLKNTIFASMLTLALVCGTVAAFPAVATAVTYSNEMSQMIRDQIYVKTQTVDFTTDEGKTIQVAISSNSDDSKMMMYADIYGDKEHAILHLNEDGSYEVKDSTLSEADALKIAELASNNGHWKEM